MHAADLHNGEEIRKDTGKRQHTAHRDTLCSCMSRISIERIKPRSTREQRAWDARVTREAVPAHGGTWVAFRVHTVGPHLPLDRGVFLMYTSYWISA